VQEELIRTEPQLASTASFLNIVSGGALGKSGTGKVSGGMTDVAVDATVIKEAINSVVDTTAAVGKATVAGVATVAGIGTVAESTIIEGIAVVTGGVGVVDVRPDASIADVAMREKALKEARYEERMRVTRITAAKSLLRDELKKVHPSNASIATFRKAAYGDESCGETSSGQGGGRSDVVERTVETLVVVSETIATGGKGPDKVPPKEVQEAIVCGNEGTASGGITSEDDEMSIGESDDGGEISDDYSVSGQSTSEGESVVSRGNRKRRADESSEREVTGSIRKGFPGVVSRSEAGCRIHIPSTAGATTVSKVTPEIAVEARTATPITTAEMTGEAYLVTPTTMTEMAVESHTATHIASTEMAGEARISTPITTTERGVEAHTIAPTTTTSEMDVEAHTAAPLTIKELTAEACEFIPPLVSVVLIDAVGTGPVSGQPEPGVLMEVTTMTEIREVDISVSNAEHEAVARTDSTIVTTVACQSRTPMILSSNVESDAVVMGGNVGTTVNVAGPMAVESWGRDAMMVEGIFRIIEGMEPPWVTLSVLENAVIQFPNVNRDLLRHTIMTVLMSQRRCVVRLTRAGLRLGPRTDREWNAFVELDLDYADRYSNLH